MATYTITFKNTSATFLLVGDYHQVISEHEDKKDALDALESFTLVEMEQGKWGIVQVVEPGETITSHGQRTASIEQSDEDLFDKYFRKD